MVGTESLHSSWADEVEREAEEEEEAKAQLQRISKPNPFGSARPREVILQERGIDWRKLDLQSIPSRQVNSSKENTPASAINLNRSLKAEKLGFNKSAEIAAPPLRYPPRNMVASLSESRVACKSSSMPPTKQNSIRSIGKGRNLIELASHNNMNGSMEVQSKEKGRNSHSYRPNVSGSLLGRPPAMENNGVLRSKTLQRW